jgi:hypothetical protein
MRPQLGATDVYAFVIIQHPWSAPGEFNIHACTSQGKQSRLLSRACVYACAARYLLGEARDVVAVDFEIYIR